jgi:hypothetical protein
MSKKSQGGARTRHWFVQRSQRLPLHHNPIKSKSQFRPMNNISSLFLHIWPFSGGGGKSLYLPQMSADSSFYYLQGVFPIWEAIPGEIGN